MSAGHLEVHYTDDENMPEDRYRNIWRKVVCARVREIQLTGLAPLDNFKYDLNSFPRPQRGHRHLRPFVNAGPKGRSMYDRAIGSSHKGNSSAG